MINKLYAWLDQRLGLAELAALGAAKRVPLHRHTWWYFWGGAASFLFVLLVITGTLLAVYYTPGEQAHDSVGRIVHDIPGGAWFRTIHNYSASLMVFVVFGHMFSALFMRAYRRPRELTWLSGFALLLIVLTFGFTGQLLPMHELGYFASQIGVHLTDKLPLIGPAITDVLLGGTVITADTVQRFFAAHVIVLPLTFIAFLTLHLSQISRHGQATIPSESRKPPEQRRSVSFSPHMARADLLVWLILLNLIAITAALLPLELGPAADPLGPTPLDIHPEWYFLSVFQLFRVLGDWFPGIAGEYAGYLIVGVALALWALVPFLDNQPGKPRRATFVTVYGVVLLASIAGLTVWSLAA